jgi:hypothetical protein
MKHKAFIRTKVEDKEKVLEGVGVSVVVVGDGVVGAVVGLGVIVGASEGAGVGGRSVSYEKMVTS